MSITLTVTGNDAHEFKDQFRGLVAMFTTARTDSWTETPAEQAVEQKVAAHLVATGEVAGKTTVVTDPAGDAIQAPAAEPAKRTRRTKAEMEAARAAEAAAADPAPVEVAKHVELPADATSTEVAEAFANLKAEQPTAPLEGELLPAEPKEATEQDLRNALMKVSAEDKLGAEKAFGLIQQAGFAKVSEVTDAGKRAEIIAAAAALLRQVDAEG